MNIFILEDDFLHQTRIENIVRQILADQQIEVKHFDVYGKPNQLLEDISERGGHQLFLLDIEIKDDEKRGLDLAIEIRQKDPHAEIVFVTTHSEFMPVSFQYHVSALDFIDKELPEEQFTERIEQLIKYVQHQQGKTLAEDSFVFKNAKTQVQILFADLLYIETSCIAHKLVLYSTRERIEFYGELSEIIKQEPRLFQSHRSYVVNPYNISSINRDERLVYLKNGSSCLVSRLKITALKEAVANLPRRNK
ncbi:response regulator transcription factor [Streptococcus halichoeri]|uniref:response regulator transcription factor n=1 Tax=Streptococcus halichoeri TaxID=254785 RepID=UPI00135CA0AF|nr:response regulator transcription factor [Streptococcus halichoeri]